MFGLMKNLIKENAAPQAEAAMTLNELYTGCVIGFGFMPQKNISGKRLPVSEINSYLFEPDNFIACRLEQDDLDINLIVADGEDPSATYLAISQRVEPRRFEDVFTDHAPLYWFALKEGESVKVNTGVLGGLQDWLTSRYTLVISTKGKFYEGDYRLRKASEHARFSRSFDYVLLVDEDNEYALEAEKYEDGTLNVFATIYRPATDIGEITRAPKSTVVPLKSNFEKNNPEAIPVPLSLSVEKIAHEPPTEPAASPALTSVKMAGIPPESVLEIQAAKPMQTGEIKHVAPAFKAANGNTPKNELPEAASVEIPAAVSVSPVQAVLEEKISEAFAEASAQAASSVPAPETQPVSVLPVSPAVAADSVTPVPQPGTTEIGQGVPHAAIGALPDIPIVSEVPPEIVSSASEIIPVPQEVVANALLSATENEVKQPAPEAAVAEAPAQDDVKAEEPSAPVFTAIPEMLSESMPVRSKFGRIQPVSASEQMNGGILACDLQLAGKLIEEAQRNKMLLSELIRKVIDLPARVNDQVMIPFKLESGEQAELARRYNLPNSDLEAVKEQIVVELERFVGKK